jgi:hypothetical protein
VNANDNKSSDRSRFDGIFNQKNDQVLISKVTTIDLEQARNDPDLLSAVERFLKRIIGRKRLIR